MYGLIKKCRTVDYILLYDLKARTDIIFFIKYLYGLAIKKKLKHEIY